MGTKLKMVFGSDASSDGVEQASGFFNNYQTTYSMSYPMQAIGHAVKTWSVVCSMARPLQSDKRARPHCASKSEIAQHHSASE